MDRRRRIGAALAVAAALPAGPIAEACAILTLKDDTTVLMGNNEDWTEPGVIWFVPGKPGRFGRVNVGFRDDFAQGGMNEQGLAFDAAVVAQVPWEPDPARPTPQNLIEKIMNECATVEQALAYFEAHNCPHLSRSQFLFADATGDSAVVAWLPDSGLSVARIGEADHLLATNTRLRPSGYRCQRFARAEQVLATRRDVSLQTVAAVLESIHQRGPGAFTSYSTVYDLRARRVYVYNLANFDEVVRFDLPHELARKRKTRRMAELFENGPDLSELRREPQRSQYGTAVTLAAEVLERYAGIYSPTAAPEIRLRVLRDGDALLVQNPGQPDARLVPESGVSFRIAPDRGTVTFAVAPDGTVEGLTLHKQIDAFARRVAAIEP